jgi:ABC-type transport system involved in cytochrome bd biosynthesis fused ATPase/permease subunit
MHFWSGSIVSEEDIINVKKYNRDNFYMWLGYSLFYWFAAILEILGFSNAAIALVFLSCFPGVIVLIICYMFVIQKRNYKRFMRSKKY